MPAVQVALKLQARGKQVKAKDVMSFIICNASEGNQESAASNAFPIDEVLRADSPLKPDVDYYLHKQILPPVERLVAPVGMTNITRLAECLGLDTSKYRVSNASARVEQEDALLQPLESQIPDSIRFASCSPLRFRCLNSACHTSFTFRSLADDPSVIRHHGMTCPTCEQKLPNIAVVAQLEHQIRQQVAAYYDLWLVCDLCENRTRQMSVYGTRCLGPQGLARGCLGKMRFEMSEKDLWNQLTYWERAFDVERAKRANVLVGAKEDEAGEKVRILADNNRVRFETCRAVVQAYLDKSGRQWVDMAGLFGFVR